MWKIDPWLMRASGGRLGMGLVLPTALLETRGARTGKPRRNAVIYFHDGELATIVASKMGLDHDPAWFHNLVADPEVTFGGIPMRPASSMTRPSVSGSGSSPTTSSRPTPSYRRRSGESDRTIPIVQLTERSRLSP